MNKVREFYENRGMYGVAPDQVQHRAYVTVQNRLHKSLEMIKEQHPKKVLDIGCGDGFFSQRITEATGAFVAGLDISQEAIDQAKTRGIDARQCDLNSNICFNTESFDLVFCGEVIEHVFDPDLLLDEIWRILSPGGHMILSTPNLAAWYNRILLLFGIQPIFTDTSTRKTLGRFHKILGQGSQPVGHLRIYTLAALKDILNEHSFVISSVQALPFLPFPVLRQIDRLASLVPSLGSDLLVLSRKGQ